MKNLSHIRRHLPGTITFRRHGIFQLAGTISAGAPGVRHFPRPASGMESLLNAATTSTCWPHRD